MKTYPSLGTIGLAIVLVLTCAGLARADEQPVASSGDANCEITGHTADSSSITVQYNVSDCEHLYTGDDDGKAKICLKKRDAWVRACHGGQVKYSDHSSGSISFSGLVKDTTYKVHLYYAEGKKSNEGEFVKYKGVETSDIKAE